MKLVLRGAKLRHQPVDLVLMTSDLGIYVFAVLQARSFTGARQIAGLAHGPTEFVVQHSQQAYIAARHVEFVNAPVFCTRAGDHSIVAAHEDSIVLEQRSDVDLSKFLRQNGIEEVETPLYITIEAQHVLISHA